MNTDKHRFYFSSSAFSAMRNRLGLYLSAGLFSIFVVWVIFGFEWGSFAFKAEWLAGLNQNSGPMPTFWRGIEQILFWTGSGRMAYLLGEFSTEGFIHYFPIAFLAKTPLVTLLGCVFTAVILIKQTITRKRALFILGVPLLYFGVSMASNLNIGYRHLLPMLPFVYLLIAGLTEWSPAKRERQSTFALGGVFAALLVASLWIHPHYLSFFNVVVGGSANGYNVLLDSNLDWGQDLLRLQAWMDEEGVDEVNLGWFGTAVPSYYGLNYKPLPGFPSAEFLSQWSSPPFNVTAPEPGVYAISASSLMELPLPNSTAYTWFREHEPDAQIGYSILIYRVE